MVAVLFLVILLLVETVKRGQCARNWFEYCRCTIAPDGLAPAGWLEIGPFTGHSAPEVHGYCFDSL
jgi:hypothetical protein